MIKKIVQTAGREQLGDFAPQFAHLNGNVLFGELKHRRAANNRVPLKSTSALFFLQLSAGSERQEG